MSDIEGQRKERLIRLLWARAGYTPTDGAFPVYDIDGSLRVISRGQMEIHSAPERIVMVTGGVRAGKSKLIAMCLLAEAMKTDGLIWIMGPDYWQATAEFEYMYEPLLALGCIADASRPRTGGRQFVTEWGCVVETKSSKDLASIASFAPHALAGVEMGQQPKAAYEKLLERALQHRARIFLSGTLEDAHPWYSEMWDKWQGPNLEGARSFCLPSWSNTGTFPGGLDDPSIVDLKNSLSPEAFLQRVGAVPYKPTGLVFRAFDRKIHLPGEGAPGWPCVYDPALPIELAIDPAQHTYAVLAVQWRVIAGLFVKDRLGKLQPLTEVKVVDQVYEHDQSIYDIITQVQAKPWARAVKGGVIDVAGKQRHANKSQVQIWYEETGLRLRAARVSIPEGIEVVQHRLRVHPLAKQPLLFFNHTMRSDRDDRGRANGIIAEASLYEWPRWKVGMATAQRPIDANNDGFKALGYWLYDKFGSAIERRKNDSKPLIRGYL